MQCPIDGTELKMTERAGVEIDYCPRCRGVWLDRGELDKIIDRAAAEVSNRPMAMPEPARHRDRDDDDDDRYRKPYRKKRGGFLSEIFDFD
ncbi:TFIIB-type zinc ribbon-containing protein [Seohaeicola zhoushanensis]|uniref:Transcription factor zinc-finger domain-containing protein n=1 Tax=Seohaeicola zhoushanensis TaxID=1569283 RepID=A0A8J3GU62_9RHOB|nr:zf-TFIIB domain-containing protein [Seohaeicola zhoushanensis]GHF37218.1 hypothetical protein GCM10017056_06390 [Seohaeicola zhoushanensis]